MGEDVPTPLPENVLPEVQNMLRTLIDDRPAKAWQYVEDDPIAVLALSKVKSEILDSEDENHQLFLEAYDQKTKKVFDLTPLFGNTSFSLIIELLVELWRKENQSYDTKTLSALILEKLVWLSTKIPPPETNADSKIAIGMVKDAIERIRSLRNYEASKARGIWKQLELRTEDLVEQTFDVNHLDDTKNWDLMLNLTTMNVEHFSIFQKYLSNLIYGKLSSNFEDFPDELKYKFAPWLVLLEKIKERPIYY